MDALIQQISSGHVPTLSIVFIIFTLIMLLVVFIGLPIFLKLKYKCSLLDFFAGCGVWLLFAGVIEALFHNVILSSPAGAVIQGNNVLMALYGGFMAGLFEETGRFLVMKFLLKKTMNNNMNAIMYGAGHGGFEAFIILFFTMVNNLIYSVMINSGAFATAAEAFKILPEDQAVATLSSIASLCTASSGMFLIGLIERIIAIVGHISMSIFVWFSVKEKKFAYFLIAFAFHMILDAGSVLVNSISPNMYVTELCIGLFTVAFAVWAFRFFKKKNKEA